MICQSPRIQVIRCPRIGLGLLRKLLALSVTFAIFFGIYMTVYRRADRIVIVDVRGNDIGVTDRAASVTSSQNYIKKRATCVHPTLVLWPPYFKKHFNKPDSLKCSQTEENWVYASKGELYISPAAVTRHGNISCAYTPLHRGGDDFHTRWGATVAHVKSGSPIATDFFKVQCTANDSATYDNIHAGIAKIPTPKPESDRNRSLDLNVLMVGFDSVSRMTWMRNLPKSYDYLVTVLATVVMEGYNIVGDATTAALLPILTGKTETELPEARRGHRGAQPVDDHPWIWNDFRALGYVNQFAEDRCHIGAFTLRMVGFNETPVDHYMRTYYLEAEKLGTRSQPLCTGSLARHNIFLNYGLEMFRTYPSSIRKFSFLFNVELSHDSLNQLQLADDDLFDFLKQLNDGGHLDNTLLIMMSDHGARFTATRSFVQGKYVGYIHFCITRPCSRV